MNNVSKNWLIIGAAFLAGLVLIIYAGGLLKQEPTLEAEHMSARDLPKTPERELAFVEIDFGNGQRRKFSGEMHEVYELGFALKVLAETAGLKIEYDAGKINKIAGLGDTSGSWNIYRNGAQQEVLLSQLTIAAGDNYLFKYEQK